MLIFCIGSVQPAIEIQRVRFEGTLDFDENSTLIQTFWDPDSPRYTGEPSDELDARWKSLYRGKSVRRVRKPPPKDSHVNSGNSRRYRPPRRGSADNTGKDL
ncbi:unnamed protein product [Aspergillus oryzae var. brunneus]|uniref:Unnamed protein product n=1 Tax=Aspergillus oryzae var. brunneus TaxID=332754 RepID=A0ABQ6KMY5_ASPOZ|nr:unnamed protein product [Aspergillus oryzae var. brunneus]